MTVTSNLDGARERQLIEPHLRAYEGYFGSRPELSLEDEDITITFPLHREREYATAVARVDELGAHAAVRDYLTRLGFRWDDASRFTTVPSPATFDRRRRREQDDDAGFAGLLFQVPRLAIPPRRWLSSCTDGFVPYAVGTRRLYARLARRWRPGRVLRARAERYFFWGLQHDVTRHALFTHLVPSRCVRTLGERIREALADRRPLITPTPLLRFYENDLTQYCQSIWRDLPSPSRFADRFLERSSYGRLEAALADRVRQAERPSVAWLFAD